VSDLVVGELRGYRAWRVSGGFLWALCTEDRWQSATDEADCDLSPVVGGDHPAPFMGCGCGLYACYRATTVPPTVGQVFGVVAVAGRVILATRGMKAERMTILALVTDDASLGEWYGVPIYPNREGLLADYPPQDYGELVDVDPIDPPWFAWGHLAWRPVPIQRKTSGFVAGMRKATEQMAARVVPARVLAARMMAARMGVTAAEAGRAFQHLSAADQAEVKARARDLWRRRNSRPATHGVRRYGRRR
jgi:hypothetical protein